MGNASGFDVSVYTLTGENAEPTGAGGAVDRFSLPPPPAERFKRDFVFLKPGETLQWQGRTASSPTEPGKYEVVGFYIPDENQVRDLVALPRAHGLLISKPMRSASARITVE